MMDAQAENESTEILPASPGGWLDALRERADWTESQRDAWLGRLVERFSAEQVIEAVQPRLMDLTGAGGEAMLRLVEAYPKAGLLQALAEAIEAQPDLAPERAWEALGVLEGAGLLEAYPTL